MIWDGARHHDNHAPHWLTDVLCLLFVTVIIAVVWTLIWLAVE
jgi:hypothetical protein